MSVKCGSVLPLLECGIKKKNGKGDEKRQVRYQTVPFTLGQFSLVIIIITIIDGHKEFTGWYGSLN